MANKDTTGAPQGYEKVQTATFWVPGEEGVPDQISGVVKDVFELAGMSGKTTVHARIDGESASWNTAGHASLMAQVRALNKGDEVTIVYRGEGEAKSGQSAPKLYDVYKKT